MSKAKIDDVENLHPGIVRDPDYDWTPPLRPQPPRKKGLQCGECGMKFDYNAAYGYCCGNERCPTGWGRA